MSDDSDKRQKSGMPVLNGGQGDGSVPAELPVVPISDNVIFPFTIVPLSIMAPKAVAAVEYAMSRERMLAMVSVKGEI